VLDQLTDVPVSRFQVMSETGLVSLPPLSVRSTPAAPLRLLFVGRLVATKGPRFVIEALTHCADLDVHLDIVGDGPEHGVCAQMVSQHGLGEKVTLHGRTQRGAVDEFYRQAHVFVFPSYREPGGNVVFEAMGHGLPLIVCDRGGPGAATDEECAIRLPVTTPEQLVNDLATAIRVLNGDPERRRAMGVAARARVRSVGLWSGKLAAFDDLLEGMVGRD